MAEYSSRRKFSAVLEKSSRSFDGTPVKLNVEAAVTIEPEGQGCRISHSVLTLRAKVPGLDKLAFARMVGDAEKNCPISKVLNAPISVTAKLI